jgi:tetratricopeptide (TPR) repeat protein
MLEILGSLYLDLRLDDQAVALDKQRVAVAKALYGARNAAVVPALIDLGSAMHASRSVNESEAVLLEAKSILDKSGDFTSQTRASLLSFLAEHYASTDMKKSLAFAKESVSVYRKLPPSSALAEALYLAAVSHINLGEHAQAEAALNEAISISKKFDGYPNSSLARYYAYVAEAQNFQMRYSAAEQNFKLALKTARGVGGDEDIDTLETESRLGTFLATTSRPREALSYLQKAKDVCLKVKGPGDPFYTPQMLLQYGMALQADGQPAKALEFISQAVKNRRRNRPGTAYLGQMLEDQALVLIELGHYQKAGELLDEALAIRNKVRRKIDMNYTTPRIALALALGKPDEANALLNRYFGAVPDSRAPLSLAFLKNLETRAEIALLKNDGKTAITMARREADTIASSPSQPYLKTWQASAMLYEGEGYLLEHDSAKAVPLLERARDAEVELFDANSPDLAVAKAVLGTAYADLGNRVNAKNLLFESQSILRTHKELGEPYRQPTREFANRLVIVSK